MKRMKKVLAMLLAMVMVLGMSVTALAAPEDGGKTAEIEVTGVEGETPVQLTYLQICSFDFGTCKSPASLCCLIRLDNLEIG